MARTSVKAEGTAGSRPDGARERLLDAACAVLSERDTLEFSLNDIAARAQLNHGLINYYFGGKEGLLLALLKRDASVALESLAALARMDMPPLRKIELHIRGVIGTYYRFPYINRLINMLQCSSDQNAQELARVFILPLRSYQESMLADAAAGGEIGPVEPAYFYYAVIGACEFLFHSRKTLPFTMGVERISPAIIEAYSDQIVALILNGLRAR